MSSWMRSGCLTVKVPKVMSPNVSATERGITLVEVDASSAAKGLRSSLLVQPPESSHQCRQKAGRKFLAQDQHGNALVMRWSKQGKECIVSTKLRCGLCASMALQAIQIC